MWFLLIRLGHNAVEVPVRVRDKGEKESGPPLDGPNHRIRNWVQD